MAWTYSGDPADSDKDAVRFLTQDTITARQLMQDEEILWLLDQFSSVYRAAAEGAAVISARFAALPDRRIGGMNISYSSNARNYAEIAALLRRRAAVKDFGAFAGGLTQQERDDRLLDTELVAPHIYLGIHTGPYVDVGFWGTVWGRS